MPRSALGEVLPFIRARTIQILDSLGITSNGSYTPPAASLVSAVGLERTGLMLTCDSDTTISAEYGRLVLINGSGETILAESQSGTIDCTTTGANGLDYNIVTNPTPSTKHYIYAIYKENTPAYAFLVSKYSDRLGQMSFVDLPTGYTYWREIGEVYVDSSGDLVHFKRIDDHVTFRDDSVGPLFSAQNLGATFVEYTYPAKAPARASQVKFTMRQAAGAVGRMNLVLAQTSGGLSRTFEGNYTTSTNNTYDGSDNSLSVEMQPSDTDLSSASVWARGHWTFTSSATYDLYLSEYTWAV